MTDPTSSQEPARAPGRVCAAHGLQTGPDGKCTLCRRGERASVEEPSRLGTALLVLGIVASLGVLFYFFKKGPPPPPPQNRPTVAQELESIDKEIRLLRIAKSQGDISPQERNHLDILEARRRILTR